MNPADLLKAAGLGLRAIEALERQAAASERIAAALEALSKDRASC